MAAAAGGHDRLRQVLAVEVLPDDLQAIDADDADRLARAVDAARRRNVDAVEEATQRSLRHLPRLVRPAARKILGL